VSTADTQPSPPGSEGTKAACPNCGATLLGPWCAACGQRNRHPRLDVNDLVHDAFDQILGWDTKLGRTLRDFTLRPGRSARDYVEGARARYVNPLKYLLFVVALYFLLLATLDMRLTDLAPVQPRLSTDPIAAELTTAIQSTVNESMRSMIFAAPPILAWTTGLLLGRRRWNFAECCSLWLFAMAHGTLLFTVPSVLLTRLLGVPLQLWIVPLALAYYSWAAKSFFERSWWITLPVFLGAFLAFQVFVMGVFVACVVAALLIAFGLPSVA
jgi:hypothetical protein